MRFQPPPPPQYIPPLKTFVIPGQCTSILHYSDTISCCFVWTTFLILANPQTVLCAWSAQRVLIKTVATMKVNSHVLGVWQGFSNFFLEGPDEIPRKPQRAEHRAISMLIYYNIYANLLILQKQQSLAGQIDKLRIQPAGRTLRTQTWHFKVKCNPIRTFSQGTLSMWPSTWLSQVVSFNLLGLHRATTYSSSVAKGGGV